MTILHSLRRPLAAWLIVIPWWTLSASPIESDSPNLPRLHGIVLASEFRRASLVTSASPHGQWVAVGDYAGQHRLEIIERTHVVLRDETGREHRVDLPGAKPAGTTPDAGEPAPYTRRWINSQHNPMLLQPLTLPREVAHGWSRMTPGERDAIVQLYLDHGWRMAHLEIVRGGGLTVEWENIYDEERRQQLRANREAFERQLTPAQRELWDQISTPRRVVRMGADFTPEQRREIAQLQELSARLQATLSPAQRRSREAMMDFTQGDW